MAGGEKQGEKFMRRYVYDLDSADQSRWIRLRDTGTQVTLAVKEIEADTIDGTRETETIVGDFETTNQLLGRLGFTPKSYQENRRTSFLMQGVRLEIDQWPLIPPYLEIEADTEADVLNAAALLGYTPEDLTAENTIKIYRRYGHELNDLPELRFPQ
ncbi:MAG: adenylate cyclase [Actinomycetia bacterium]|nr:adenylate cyclase [Actinomycetes bacterium]